MRHRLGISVIEVIIALGMAAIFITAIGNALANVHHLDTATAQRTQALAYAQQGIEDATSFQDSLFACTPATAGNCPATYTCTPLTGYTSCWTAYPDDNDLTTPAVVTGPFSFAYVAGKWQLQTGTVNLGVSNEYTRSIYIKNLDDPAGPNNYNVKQVTAKIEWAGKSVELSTILTGWKPIP